MIDEHGNFSLLSERYDVAWGRRFLGGPSHSAPMTTSTLWTVVARLRAKNGDVAGAARARRNGSTVSSAHHNCSHHQ